jgi:hypothetical protein
MDAVSAAHSTRFFWSDWLGDQAVRRLSLSERGLWIDLLAIASSGIPTGYVTDGKGKPLSDEDIARVSNVSPKDVAELIESILEKGAASRDRTGRLFNRRMVRDASLAAKRARNGRVGGDHTALINKSYRVLAEQVAKQKDTAQRGPSLSKYNNLSSETTSAREVSKPSLVGDEGTKIPIASPRLEAINKARGWV